MTLIPLKDHLRQLLPLVEEADVEYLVDMLRDHPFYDLSDPLARHRILHHDLDDFIYWKRLNLIGFNLFANHLSHGLTLAQLYIIEKAHENLATDILDVVDECQAQFKQEDVLKIDPSIGEAFIKEGRGFYLSSARGYGAARIQMGSCYRMSAQEKILFKSYPVRLLDDDTSG